MDVVARPGSRTPLDHAWEGRAGGQGGGGRDVAIRLRHQPRSPFPLFPQTRTEVTDVTAITANLSISHSVPTRNIRRPYRYNLVSSSSLLNRHRLARPLELLNLKQSPSGFSADYSSRKIGPTTQNVRRTLRKRSEHADHQIQSDSQRPRVSNMFCFSFRLLPDPPIQASSWLHPVFRFARTGHYIVLYPTFYRPVRSPTSGRRREIALFGPVRRARPNSKFYRPVVAATVPENQLQYTVDCQRYATHCCGNVDCVGSAQVSSRTRAPSVPFASVGSGSSCESRTDARACPRCFSVEVTALGRMLSLVVLS